LKREAIKGSARSPLAPPSFDQPRGVADHLVDLDGDAVAPGRHLERVRNEKDLEIVAVDRVDGERGSASQLVLMKRQGGLRIT
jgi:hypothetical protein